jgi:hypothetical protein
MRNFGIRPEHPCGPEDAAPRGQAGLGIPDGSPWLAGVRLAEPSGGTWGYVREIQAVRREPRREIRRDLGLRTGDPGCPEEAAPRNQAGLGAPDGRSWLPGGSRAEKPGGTWGSGREILDPGAEALNSLHCQGASDCSATAPAVTPRLVDCESQASLPSAPTVFAEHARTGNSDGRSPLHRRQGLRRPPRQESPDGVCPRPLRQLCLCQPSTGSAQLAGLLGRPAREGLEAIEGNDHGPPPHGPRPATRPPWTRIGPPGH